MAGLASIFDRLQVRYWRLISLLSHAGARLQPIRVSHGSVLQQHRADCLQHTRGMPNSGVPQPIPCTGRT